MCGTVPNGLLGLYNAINVSQILHEELMQKASKSYNKPKSKKQVPPNLLFGYAKLFQFPDVSVVLCNGSI